MFIGAVIPADDQQPIYTTVINSLVDLQTIVDGDIEPVTILGTAQGIIWCNAEGKLQRRYINWRATALHWMSNSNDKRGAKDMIVGDCLVSGLATPDGEDTDFTESVAALIEDKPYKVAMKLVTGRWVVLPLTFDTCLAAIGYSFKARHKMSDKVLAGQVFPADMDLDLDALD